MARGYNQHCTLAHALDQVGERWTLLIVRELLTGPRRYTDLARGLVTVPTNVLAERLRDLEKRELIRKRRLSAPAQQVAVYELTEEGAALSEAVAALARWGMRSLPVSSDGRVFRARWLILAMEARFDPDAAAGIEESYQLQVEGDEPIHFLVKDGQGNARAGAATDPAVSVTADAETLLALANGAITVPDAIANGALVEGLPDAILRMREILPPPPTTESARTITAP